MVIPFVKAKWPIAVNNNMADIAIRPAKGKSNVCVNNLVASKLMINTPSSMNSGFMVVLLGV